MGSVYPLTLSTVGATITNDGNISGGTYSNTFTGLSLTNATYFVAYATTNPGTTSYGNPLIIPQQTVYNAATLRTWMAYNVGASNIPTSLTDTAGYGFLFQWGRGADGHQYVRPTPSGTTTTIVANDIPNNGGLFIIGFGVDGKWRNTPNTTLWTGNTTGNNNPCPTGFRVPTNSEFDDEIATWGGTLKNGDAAFNSSLRLTYGGYREYPTGNLLEVGTAGWYWVSNSISTGKNYYYKKISSSRFTSNTTALQANAMSVRCIKYQN
jgi:uncharacterized protein (TIGR02145 family)